MQEAGWEIASHGLKWIDYRDYTIEDERRDMEAAIRLHAEVTGERPTGWYTGRTSAQHGAARRRGRRLRLCLRHL